MLNILILNIKTLTLITLSKAPFINLEITFLLRSLIFIITTFNITIYKLRLLKAIEKRILCENETTITLKT